MRSFVTIFGWLAVVAGLCLSGMNVIGGGVYLSYHPDGFNSHLVIPMILLSGIGTVLLLGVAIWDTVYTGRKFLVILAVPLVMVLLFAISNFMLGPSHIKFISYQGFSYAIPQTYDPIVSSDGNGEQSSLSLSVCRGKFDPAYTLTYFGYASACRQTDLRTTSGPIVIENTISSHLENAGAIVKTGRILQKGTLIQIDDTLYDTYDSSTWRVAIRVAPDGRILSFQQCYRQFEYGCTATDSKGGQTFIYNSNPSKPLQPQTEAAAALIENWRCAELTCGGQFTQ